MDFIPPVEYIKNNCPNTEVIIVIFCDGGINSFEKEMNALVKDSGGSVRLYGPYEDPNAEPYYVEGIDIKIPIKSEEEVKNN